MLSFVFMVTIALYILSPLKCAWEFFTSKLLTLAISKRLKVEKT